MHTCACVQVFRHTWCVAGQMENQLDAALIGVEEHLTDQDKATVELARTYARAIDDGGADLTRVGPALLNCLESLHMSPRARGALTKGVARDHDDRASALDQLRQRRARRNAPPAVHGASV